MGAPRLSAAMIVRDEEAHLAACLESLRGIADEVVVVDTGSRDATPEIARRAGARLERFAWCGDFAAARNAALDHAGGDWILYIDADERAHGDRAALDALLADPRHAALTVRFRPVTGFTRYREIRLFRRLPEVRFRGVIHESHLPALREALVARGLAVADSDLAIDHLGYDRDRPDKHVRNLPLLEERLRREPGNVYCWAHLGGTLEALGRDTEAEDAWRRGIAVVRAKAVCTEVDSLPYLGLLRSLERRGGNTEELLREAWERFPRVAEVTWRWALRLVAGGAQQEALPLLEALAAVDPDAHVEPLMAHDQRLFRVWVHDALALCRFRLGDFAASAHHHALAERAEPTRERMAKRLLAEARARRGAAQASPAGNG